MSYYISENETFKKSIQKNNNNNNNNNIQICVSQFSQTRLYGSWKI